MAQAGLDEIGAGGNAEEEDEEVGALPEEGVDPGEDEHAARGHEADLEEAKPRPEPPPPVQGRFEPERDGGDEDEGQERRDRQSADDGDGEGGADHRDVFRFAQGDGKHAQDGRDRRDQDRPDAAAAGGHEGPLPAEAPPLELAGIIDQDDGVVDHDPEEDEEADDRVGVVDRVRGQDQGQEGPDPGEREGEHDDERGQESLESRSQDHIDEGDAQDEEEAQVGHLALVANDFDQHPGRRDDPAGQALDRSARLFEQNARLLDLGPEAVGHLDLLLLVDPV